MRHLLLPLLLILSTPVIARTVAPEGAVEPPPAVLNSLSAMQESCAAFGGVLAEGDDSSTGGREAFTSIDITGDGISDWILDQGAYHCSAEAWSPCGSSGCGLEIYVDGAEAGTMLAKSWEIIPGADKPPVLQVITSGEPCAISAAQLCAMDFQWNGTDMAVTRAEPAD